MPGVIVAAVLRRRLGFTRDSGSLPQAPSAGAPSRHSGWAMPSLEPSSLPAQADAPSKPGAQRATAASMAPLSGRNAITPSTDIRIVSGPRMSLARMRASRELPAPEWFGLATSSTATELAIATPTTQRARSTRHPIPPTRVRLGCLCSSRTSLIPTSDQGRDSQDGPALAVLIRSARLGSSPHEFLSLRHPPHRLELGLGGGAHGVHGSMGRTVCARRVPHHGLARNRWTAPIQHLRCHPRQPGTGDHHPRSGLARGAPGWIPSDHLVQHGGRPQPGL